MLYPKLLELFEGTVATGAHALGSALVSDSADQDVNLDQEQAGNFQSRNAFSRDDSGSSVLDLPERRTPSAKWEREGFLDTPPSSNRSPFRRRKTAGESISESIDKLTASRIQLARPTEAWSTMAVEELFKELAAEMSEDEVNQALLVLEDLSKAAIFCKIPKGRSRQIWMQMQIRLKQDTSATTIEH